jgi:hypothetical protein
MLKQSKVLKVIGTFKIDFTQRKYHRNTELKLQK